MIGANPLQFAAELEAEDLAALIDLAGPPPAVTLRPAVDAVRPSRALAGRLADAGLIANGQIKYEALKPAGRIVADVLRAPGRVIECSLWGGGMRGMMTIAFPQTPAAGVGILLNRADGRLRIGGFADDHAITAAIEPVLTILPLHPATKLEAVLSVDQAAVLAAVLDCCVADNAQKKRPFSARRITEWLDIWWGSTAINRLVGHVFALVLEPVPPSENAIRHALESLTMAGLLQTTRQGSYRLAEAARSLEAIAGSIAAGFDLSSLHMVDEGNTTGRVVHVLAGVDGAMLLELAGEDRLRWTVAGREEVASLVASELTGKAQAPAAKLPKRPRQALKSGYCIHCGQPLQENWKFCVACGALIERKTRA